MSFFVIAYLVLSPLGNTLPLSWICMASNNIIMASLAIFDILIRITQYFAHVFHPKHEKLMFSTYNVS